MTIKMPPRLKYWEYEAFDWLMENLSPADDDVFLITPAQWKLIRDREPVDGCSDISEVAIGFIAQWTREHLSGMIVAIRDRDQKRIRAIIQNSKLRQRMKQMNKACGR